MIFFTLSSQPTAKGYIYILSIETNKHIKAVTVQHILFSAVIAVLKAPSHSRACFKGVHENTNNYRHFSTTMATVYTFTLEGIMIEL